MNTRRLLHIVALMVLPCLYSTAQINLKIGYSATFLDPLENNQILLQHNSENPTYVNSFNELKFLNGFETGFRYKFHFTAFELSYRIKTKRLSADGSDPSNNSAFTNKLNYNLNAFSFAWENHIDFFSIGVSFDYNLIRIKPSFETDGNYLIYKDNPMSSHFYLNFNFVGAGQTSMTLRPFYQHFWNESDLSSFAEQMLIDPIANSGASTRWNNFGISIIFYNGPS